VELPEATLEVLSMRGRRVLKVRVLRRPPAEELDSQEE
jgi:hypothetical protein